MAGFEGKTSHKIAPKYARNEAFIREVYQEIKRWEEELGELYQEELLQRSYS